MVIWLSLEILPPAGAPGGGFFIRVNGQFSTPFLGGCTAALNQAAAFLLARHLHMRLYGYPVISSYWLRQNPIGRHAGGVLF